MAVDVYTIVWLCLAAFAAGFVDAIVGGGGLIQTPIGLILLPNLPVATVIGTLKIPAFSGTFCCKTVLKKSRHELETTNNHDGFSVHIIVFWFLLFNTSAQQFYETHFIGCVGNCCNLYIQ
jgi:hypothetical protein